MPHQPAPPCRQLGCAALVLGGGYCDRHKRAGRSRRHTPGTGYDDRRAKTAERGYDAEWRKVREAYLDEAGWTCERCGKRAVLVHHRVPVSKAPALRLERSNLMALCRGCHNIIHGRPADSGRR